MVFFFPPKVGSVFTAALPRGGGARSCLGLSWSGSLLKPWVPLLSTIRLASPSSSGTSVSRAASPFVNLTLGARGQVHGAQARGP